MPKSPCLEPNCPNFVEVKGRCREHYRARERERNWQTPTDSKSRERRVRSQGDA
jgi:hypothetical protein